LASSPKVAFEAGIPCLWGLWLKPEQQEFDPKQGRFNELDTSISTELLTGCISVG
jgi:hypothetical protein